MKTITVKINDDKGVSVVTELLKSLDFVSSVEVTDEDELTADEIRLVEERWEEYQRNPSALSTWEEVKERILKKHGL